MTASMPDTAARAAARHGTRQPSAAFKRPVSRPCWCKVKDCCQPLSGGAVTRRASCVLGRTCMPCAADQHGVGAGGLEPVRHGMAQHKPGEVRPLWKPLCGTHHPGLLLAPPSCFPLPLLACCPCSCLAHSQVLQSLFDLVHDGDEGRLHTEGEHSQLPRLVTRIAQHNTARRNLRACGPEGEDSGPRECGGASWWAQGPSAGGAGPGQGGRVCCCYCQVSQVCHSTFLVAGPGRHAEQAQQNYTTKQCAGCCTAPGSAPAGRQRHLRPSAGARLFFPTQKRPWRSWCLVLRFTRRVSVEYRAPAGPGRMQLLASTEQFRCSSERAVPMTNRNTANAARCRLRKECMLCDDRAR